MRKLLVKHFVLGYILKIFGYQLSAPRASRVIMSLIIICGLMEGIDNKYIAIPNLIIYFFETLFFISLLVTFVYFEFYPVKWEELDAFQKFQYGTFNSDRLTKEQFLEWSSIAEDLFDDE